MIKITFQTIVSLIVWCAILLPFCLPDIIYATAADMIMNKAVKYKYWANIWMTISVITMITLTYLQLFYMAGSLYEWHTGKILEKYNK